MSESRIVWRRVSRGLWFIGFGVFLLLSTQGQLHPGFWLDALVLWPVCIIAFGIRLMFERSRTPWVVLLSPLIIIGTLSYVAWVGPGPRSDDWKTVRADRDPQVETWSLEARMAGVELDLRAGSLARGALLQGRTAPPNRGSVGVSDRGASARVNLRSGHWRPGRGHLLPGRRQRWDVEVTDDLPKTLRLQTAFTKGELALDAVEVTRVELEGAFNDFTLRLGAPCTDTRIELEGAFNDLELVIPEDTPVRVTTDGFINLVDRRATDRALSGPTYRLRSDGAFNRIIIRSG